MLTVYLSIGFGLLLSNYASIVRGFESTKVATILTAVLFVGGWPLIIADLVWKTHHRKNYTVIVNEMVREIKVAMAQAILTGNYSSFNPLAIFQSTTDKHKLTRHDLEQVKTLLMPLIEKELESFQASMEADLGVTRTDSGPGNA